MVVDDSQDYFFDIHAVSDEDFGLIFPNTDQNVEFHDDLYMRPDLEALYPVFKRMWYHRVPTPTTAGIDGMLFYENWDRKAYFPGKCDRDPPGLPALHPSDDRKQIILFHRDPVVGIYASAVGVATYEAIFPEGRDVEFISDLKKRVSADRLGGIRDEIDCNRMRKSDMTRIDGVLYFGYPDKKEYFVTKIDADIPSHYPLFAG